MKVPIAEREAQWQQFLERWPLESLGSMTLSQYSEAGNQDCFVYWLEARTESLGSIWGGSSFKFGVYSRKDQSDKVEDSSRRYSSDYAWIAKYGETAEAAFSQVRENILKVAQAARVGDLAAIDKVDLGHVYKWKLAFLYQDRDVPTIIPIYSLRHLKAASGNAAANQASTLHLALLANRGDEPFFSYADRLLTQANEQLASESDVQEMLARFASDPRLQKSLRSPEDRLLFVRLAKIVHEQGWDWWTVRQKQSGSIRFGRNKSLEGSTTYVVVMLDPQEKGMLVRLHKRVTIDDEWQPLSEALVDRIEQDDFAAGLRFSLKVERPGRWPNDYLDSNGQAVDEVEEGSLMNISQPALNQILYGPPGTGKTYATIDAALAVLAPQVLVDYPGESGRQQRKEVFDKFVNEERIQFSTFHQSFSYEDFVEGIRPMPNLEGQLEYNVEPGIFRRALRGCAHLERADRRGAAGNQSQGVENLHRWYWRQSDTGLLL
jgi:5-methylcytosine-specific restriction protein B